MYDRILVPLDGSAIAEAALSHACEIARRFDGCLVLLRVVEPLMVPPWPSFAGPDLTVREHPGDAAAAAEYLRDQARALSGDGCRVETLVRHGTAADQILAAARELSIDLVVMTATGRGGIARLIGGSTAEAVLARAPAPILVVQIPARRADAAGA
jgi:nucleotide-binding universal stress UspA family protein